MTTQERRILDTLDRKIDATPADLSPEMISLYRLLMRKYLQQMASSLIYDAVEGSAAGGSVLASAAGNR